ncbi:shikimate kinase [Paucilactobacillus suebicus]|uniref:Shikimate kinase n=1 Tax=Paucilactobacillus suebicus DSM 5007 = KCTC 3549 TaxID=1423807 RepID=A0A0R1VXC2_9LACO|nr:shikimate kinase [Paucilactobacillus suebicus]KRM10215.1 shikimate kinase [Paucilactobacillus suebicus DSM 5007 = KCTC 3549]
MTSSIALIGFMGAGKTTVGAKLAPQLNTYQRDLDEVIERELGESIQEFFAREGEERFRLIETQALKKQLDQVGVLSTGGGVVMRKENRGLLSKSKVPVIYLRTQPEELLDRLQGDEQRPLLQQMDRDGFIRLWEYRDPLYREAADIIVDTDGINADQVATQIIEQLEDD